MSDIIVLAAEIISFTAENLGTDIVVKKPVENDVVYIPNTGRSFYLLVRNLSAVNTPVLTFETPQTVDKLEVAVDDYTYNCVVSDFKQLGPFTPELFNTPSDDPVLAAAVKITVSGTTVADELELSFVHAQLV